MDSNHGNANALANKKPNHPSRIGWRAANDDFFEHDVSCPRCTVDCAPRTDEYTLTLSALSMPARRLFHVMVARSGWGRRIVSYPVPLWADQAGISERAGWSAIDELLHGQHRRRGFGEDVLIEEVALSRDERGRSFFNCTADCQSHGAAPGRHLTNHRAFRIKLHPGHEAQTCACWDNNRPKEATPWAHRVPSWMFAMRTKSGSPPVPLLMAEVALYLAGSGCELFKANATVISGMGLDHSTSRTLSSVVRNLEAFGCGKRTMRKRHSTKISLELDRPASVEVEWRQPAKERSTPMHGATDNPAPDYRQPCAELPTTLHITTDLDKGSEPKAKVKAAGEVEVDGDEESHFDVISDEESNTQIRTALGRAREDAALASPPLLETFSALHDKLLQIVRLNSGPDSPERDGIGKLLREEVCAIFDRIPAAQHPQLVRELVERAPETDRERFTRELIAALKARSPLDAKAASLKRRKIAS